MIRDILNSDGQKIGELELPDETAESVWQDRLAKYAMPQQSPEEIVFSSKVHEWETDSEFARLVVATLQITCDDYGFSDEQRIWLQHRLRAVPVVVSGDPAIVDMLNLVVSGEARGALFAVRQLVPDALDKPYHCLTAELVYALKAMLLDYLGLPAEAP